MQLRNGVNQSQSQSRAATLLPPLKGFDQPIALLHWNAHTVISNLQQNFLIAANQAHHNIAIRASVLVSVLEKIDKQLLDQVFIAPYANIGVQLSPLKGLTHILSNRLIDLDHLTHQRGQIDVHKTRPKNASLQLRQPQ